MPNNESLADLFFSKLRTAPNPGVLLAQYYSAIHGVSVGRSEVVLTGKLVKIFGRTAVFFAITDTSKLENPETFPYGLIHHICKTKLEKSAEQDLAMTAMYSLERKIADIEKEILKIKKIDPEKAINKYLEGDNG